MSADGGVGLKLEIGDLLKAEQPDREAVGGVQVVTIPLADYAELLAAKERLERLKLPKLTRLPASPIERRPEVRDFILERFGKMKDVEIIAKCKETFGWAPSTSAIDRFFHRSCKSR